VNAVELLAVLEAPASQSPAAIGSLLAPASQSQVAQKLAFTAELLRFARKTGKVGEYLGRVLPAQLQQALTPDLFREACADPDVLSELVFVLRGVSEPQRNAALTEFLPQVARLLTRTVAEALPPHPYLLAWHMVNADLVKVNELMDSLKLAFPASVVRFWRTVAVASRSSLICSIVDNHFTSAAQDHQKQQQQQHQGPDSLALLNPCHMLKELLQGIYVTPWATTLLEFHKALHSRLPQTLNSAYQYSELLLEILTLRWEQYPIERFLDDLLLPHTPLKGQIVDAVLRSAVRARQDELLSGQAVSYLAQNIWGRVVAQETNGQYLTLVDTLLQLQASGIVTVPPCPADLLPTVAASVTLLPELTHRHLSLWKQAQFDEALQQFMLEESISASKPRLMALLILRYGERLPRFETEVVRGVAHLNSTLVFTALATRCSAAALLGHDQVLVNLALNTLDHKVIKALESKKLLDRVPRSIMLQTIVLACREQKPEVARTLLSKGFEATLDVESSEALAEGVLTWGAIHKSEAILDVYTRWDTMPVVDALFIVLIAEPGPGILNRVIGSLRPPPTRESCAPLAAILQGDGKFEALQELARRGLC